MGRILVVDDDRAMGETLVQGLARDGRELNSVTASGAALDELRSAELDLVITDLRMPGVDGIELCRRIVQEAEVPVIVLTAFGDYDAAVAAMRAGAYDFLSKPV